MLDGLGNVMLSTADNPFNPFKQWREWYMWDALHGYHTPSYLARVVVTSDELSEADQLLAIDEAMKEIVSENPVGMYVLIAAED